MAIRALFLSFFLIVTCSALWVAPAEAQATRTWVSGVGDDANPCSRTAPCKTFAGAISKTAAGGEISTLDPGGFGAVTITKSISITNDNSGEAGILSSGTNGIIINGAGIVVHLRGLVIDGAGGSPGLNGIRILNAAQVDIQNCVVKNFNAGAPNGFGVDFQSSADTQLNISDTVFAANGGSPGGGAVSIYLTGSGNATATLTRVVAEGNVRGLRFETTTAATINATIFETTSAGGTFGDGIAAFSTAGAVQVMVADSIVSNNVVGARAVGASAAIRFSNVEITGNGTGLVTTSGGQLLSYGNNHIDGNTANGPSPSIISAK